jgi:hypothetical protein
VTDLHFGTVQDNDGPTTVVTDGDTAGGLLTVSKTVGGLPAVGERVLWCIVDGRVVTFRMVAAP